MRSAAAARRKNRFNCEETHDDQDPESGMPPARVPCVADLEPGSSLLTACLPLLVEPPRAAAGRTARACASHTVSAPRRACMGARCSIVSFFREGQLLSHHGTIATSGTAPDR